MTHFPFHPLQTHNEVLIVCFTSAQSHSWPHRPQGGGVNVFVTFLCCHLGKPHTLPDEHLLTVIADHIDHKEITYIFV